MNIHTSHRHISPRTKRKYRAIKGFFKRALGTLSQPGTKTSSSIEISVSDLKSKINCIEQQLNSVSKHCQDLTCLEHAFTDESANSQALSERNERPVTCQENSNTVVNDVEAKLLYKALSRQHRKSDENTAPVNDDTDDMVSANQRVVQNIQDFQSKRKNIELRERNRDRNDIELPNRGKVHSKYKKLEPVYSTSSFHSLIEAGNKNYSKPGCSSHRHEKKHPRKNYLEPIISREHRDREALKKMLRSHEKEFTDKPKTTRTKRVRSEIDQDFIADIIKKQYRPVKLFGRRDSDFSQFSAPVCRDQEFTMRDQIQEGVELCSCCFDNCRRRMNHYVRHSDLSDMRSICDTRLYSSKKSRRHNPEREYDDYNNSAYYDVVPVKEKSSPKARKKFAEDNMIAYQCCKEVPPSPRSNRPRLNLKVQHYEEGTFNGNYQSRRNSPAREIRKKITNEVESDVSFESYSQRSPPKTFKNAKSQKPVQIHEDVRSMSSLQYPSFANDQGNIPHNDITLNTQLTDSSADKTDKTLCDIKDILRTFLLEIKKESTCSGRTDGTGKIENKQCTEQQGNVNTNSNMLPNSGHSFNKCSVGQCGVPPFIPTFPNSCCLPILPVCPMNCAQNGYIIPTPSYTCNMCAKASREHTCQNKDPLERNKLTEDNKTNNETQELIKEIYKFVSQKPKSPRKRNDDDNENLSARSRNERLCNQKFVTNRCSYVSGSRRPSKHDANVGTPHLKYYSKSCEAIGSRIASDTHTTNASYSDTILEKLSLEATHSSTEIDSTADVAEEKIKRVKVKKKFNPLRLFRKKKKDVIEELSESESTVEVEVKTKPPFQQRIQNYTMHGQEFYHPPPIPPQHCCHSPRHDCGYGYDPQICYQPPPPDFHNHHKHHHDYTPAPQYNPKYPIAPHYPNYDAHHNQIPPQVPLCLKEIEVKSIGIQSDRKVSILQKFTKKIPVQQQKETTVRETNWKHLSENAPAKAAKEKTSFWKSLQEKAKQNDDTMNFSLNTQKQLEQGDMNIRNAMMKKLFYKRNPFSPRNLIVRTLLGKDKSSYGNPPKMYRPRMFV